MNVLFWQMILPLGVTGGCAVLVLWLCSRAARRLGGGSLPPWLLAGAMAFYLFPLKGLLPARVQASGAAAAIGGTGRVWAGTAVPLAQAPVWTWLLPRLWLAGVGLLAAAFAGRWLWFRFRLARLRRQFAHDFVQHRRLLLADGPRTHRRDGQFVGKPV